ncbi:hypothetical protein MKW98_023022 [Papaver atlanticum]|uniref:Uncharacterized protein n=1 Tax=Papaver atlanticum TaxID=357466 RepID=A0AAD4TAV6_9MAGN|nr:hypothetical protein MKW98_023022 [Papaver atlanticum]
MEREIAASDNHTQNNFGIAADQYENFVVELPGIRHPSIRTAPRNVVRSQNSDIAPMWKSGFSFGIVQNTDKWNVVRSLIINAIISADPFKPEYICTFLYGSTYHDEKMQQRNYICKSQCCVFRYQHERTQWDQGPIYVGTGCVFRRQALYGNDAPVMKKPPGKLFAKMVLSFFCAEKEKWENKTEGEEKENETQGNIKADPCARKYRRRDERIG